MMVHIKPNTMEGRPSTISVELMFTSLICSEIIQSDILVWLKEWNPISECNKTIGIGFLWSQTCRLRTHHLSIYSQTYVYTKLTIYSMGLILRTAAVLWSDHIYSMQWTNKTACTTITDRRSSVGRLGGRRWWSGQIKEGQERRKAFRDTLNVFDWREGHLIDCEIADTGSITEVR